MEQEQVLGLLEIMPEYWDKWDDVNRGPAVWMLHQHGYSLRGLARLVGCSEGLVRYLKPLGEMPESWRQRIDRGESTRRVMAEWRAQYRR